MRNKKPYHYSRKAKRYVSNTKKSNRNYYYKYLQDNFVCPQFDPNSTFGKFVLNKIIRDLRKCRSIVKELDRKLTESRNLVQTNDYDELLSQYKDHYKRLIRQEAEMISRQNHEKIFFIRDYIWFLIPLAGFGLLIAFKNLVLCVGAFILVFWLWSVCTDAFDRIYEDRYMDVARLSPKLTTPERSIEILKQGERKKVQQRRNDIKELLEKKKELEVTVNRKIEHIFSIDRLEFILSDSFYSSIEWRKVRELALHKLPKRCNLCGSESDLAVDHIKPRSKFPELALDVANTQILCRICNSSKGNST